MHHEAPQSIELKGSCFFIGQILEHARDVGPIAHADGTVESRHDRLRSAADHLQKGMRAVSEKSLVRLGQTLCAKPCQARGMM